MPLLAPVTIAIRFVVVMPRVNRVPVRRARRCEYLAPGPPWRHDGIVSARALAEFLRDRRSRLRPADLGIASITRRRTPGLRREEVAERSRMSTEYYTQLEQARGANPSRDTLDGLSVALRLSRAERTYLYHLAGESPPPDRQIPSEPPESLLLLLDRMVDTAVLVVDAKQELIAWNALAGLLLDECAQMEVPYRNLARRFFLHPDPRARHFGMSLSEGYALYLAAELRTAAAKYPHDAGLTSLIAEMRSRSADFERL